MLTIVKATVNSQRTELTLATKLFSFGMADHGHCRHIKENAYSLEAIYFIKKHYISSLHNYILAKKNL